MNEQYSKLIELLDLWDSERKTSYAQSTLRNLMVGALCMALKLDIINSKKCQELRDKYSLN